MKKIWNWIRNEHPTWVAAGVGVAVTVGLGFTDLNITEEQKTAIITVVLMLLGVATHAVVTPTVKAQDRAVDAVRGLDGMVVGPVGQVGELAENVIRDVVGGVGSVLR